MGCRTSAKRRRAVRGTGYAGNGLTFGTLCGIMACRPHPGSREPLDANCSITGRTKIRGGPGTTSPRTRTTPTIGFAIGLRGSRARSLRSLHRGEGKVVDADGQQAAAYRRDDGKARVAICHLLAYGMSGAVERRRATWDCPCHGSRFAPGGSVISGPAESPLPPVEG